MYSKSTKKKLRQLSNIAFERELGKHLDELFHHFEKWKNDEIESSDLSHLIHKFHDGTAREIYKIYNYFSEDDLVARAFVKKLISEDELTNPIKEQIESRIKIFENQINHKY